VATHILRLSVSSAELGRYQAEISLHQGDCEIQRASTEFSFELPVGDRELFRWYWEDFLDYPRPPRDAVAARAVERLSAVGAELFHLVFGAAGAQELWPGLVPHLAQSRIEIVAAAASGCAALPWELLRDPASGIALATDSLSFVRRPALEASAFPSATPDGGPLRVLLVASPPPLVPRLPFRSTAPWLVQQLSSNTRHPVVLDLLRPPTFAQLHNVLLEAEAVGQPYHILQIDSCGLLANVEDDGLPAALGEDRSPHLCTQVLPGSHGYLVFSNPATEGSLQLVEGRSLGALMAEARVPALVLNAARASGSSFAGSPGDALTGDSQSEVFDSVADTAMREGVKGVLHVPYNFDPAATADLLLKTYSWLGQGLPLGQAVNQQRKLLRKQGRRQTSLSQVEMQDWPAPVVYETVPQRLVKGEPVAAAAGGGKRADSTPWLYANAALQPVGSCLGRHETILAMDTAWHTHSIILLQGGAGAGKSAIAAEFARWCKKTGTIEGPVLYTSFERYQPLATLLDQLAGVFWEALDKAGYRWETLSSEDRMDVALHVLHRVPVLWIWDSVERISGYPDPATPRWSAKRREDLMEFLQHAEATPAKFVLLSRQDEESWLEDLSKQIHLPPLDMRERLQLARQVVESQGYKSQQVEDWLPLLEYTQGNPLALQCLAAYVASEELKTPGQVRDLVAQVRLLELPTEDAVNDGLSEPLRATLEYVVKKAFRKGERRLLALLHLFRETVSQAAFLELGAAEWPSAGSQPPGENAVPALMEIFGPRLLERAATHGLLVSHGNGLYCIQPASVSLLEKLFKKYYPDAQEGKRLSSLKKAPSKKNADQDAARRQTEEAGVEGPSPGLAPPEDEDDTAPAARTSMDQVSLSSLSGWAHKKDPGRDAQRAFALLFHKLAEGWTREIEAGNSGVAADLDAFEANLLFAAELARENEWWDLVAGPVKGLASLYQSTGRIARLNDLVKWIQPHCTEKGTGAAVPGRELFWRALTGIAAQLARTRDRLHSAAALQELCARWDREQAAAYLSADPATLQENERLAVDTLSDSLYRLSEILRRQGFQSSQVEEEAVTLRQQLNETKTAAAWSREIGQHYVEILAIRDLVSAERWLRRSLELTAPEARAARAECLALLGRVAWERFNEARQANQPERDLIRHLASARKYYQRALVQDTPDDHASLSRHNQELGHVCYALGDLDRALPYYRDCIRHAEAAGHTAQAAHARFDLAIALRDSNRLEMARRYALEALRDFQNLGEAEVRMMERAERLVTLIERKTPSIIEESSSAVR
jgi:hypothetical protein